MGEPDASTAARNRAPGTGEPATAGMGWRYTSNTVSTDWERQAFRQAEAQTAVGTGHDGESAGQVRHFQRQIGFHHVTGSS